MLSTYLILPVILISIISGNVLAATSNGGGGKNSTHVSGDNGHSDSPVSRKPRSQRIRECKITASGDLVECTNSCYGLLPDKSGNSRVHSCQDVCDLAYQMAIGACNRIQ